MKNRSLIGEYVTRFIDKIVGKIFEAEEEYCAHFYALAESINRSRRFSDVEKDQQLIKILPSIIALSEMYRSSEEHLHLERWAKGVLNPVLRRTGNKPLEGLVADARVSPEIRRLHDFYELISKLKNNESPATEKYSSVKKAEKQKELLASGNKSILQNKKYLTASELSNVVGVDIKNIYNAIQRRRLKYTLVDGKKMISLEDFEAYKQARYIRKGKENPKDLASRVKGFMRAMEASLKLGVTEAAIYNLVSTGRLKYTLVDGKKMLAEADVEEYMNTRQQRRNKFTAPKTAPETKENPANSSIRNNPLNGAENLTFKQREIVKLLGENVPVEQIAEKFHITPEKVNEIAEKAKNQIRSSGN